MDGARIILGLESSCDETAAAVVRAVPAGPWARCSPPRSLGQDTLHAAFGGVVPEIAARAHAERLDLVTEAALARAGPRPRRHRRGGGHRRAGADRRGARRGDVRQGPRRRPPPAALRRQPPRRARADAAAGRGGRLPLSRCCWSPAGTASSSPSRARSASSASAAPSTTPPARPSTRSPKLLGLGQPGGPGVERAAALRRRPSLALPRPLLDAPGCDSLLLRAEDRGAPGARPLVARAGRAHPRRPRRPLRRLPGGGGRDPGREDPPRLRRLPRPPSRSAAGAGGRRRRGGERRDPRRPGAGGRARGLRLGSRRRSRSAPTTAR